MTRIDIETAVLRKVALVTVASGVVQVVAPSVTLDRLAHRPDALSRHLFSTVGMFMVVSGRFLSDSLHRPAQESGGALGWCAAQKLGSAAAVAIGTKRKVFSPLALLVATFDFVSGLLILRYRHRNRA